ncbi:MAG: hypothetical protein DSO04_00270 [Hadesarchaea archaeon]|nr:MAG: hypothetical protein DSO04_00270 [Hadesarchaea archaeon]
MGKVRVRKICLVLKDPSGAVELVQRLGELECDLEAEVRGSHVTIQLKGSPEEVNRARGEVEEILREVRG